MHGHHKRRLGDRMVPPLDTHGFMARADSAHALSSTTIIIIAVCCSVGGIVLGFAMWRLFRAYRSTSAPLPPVQPLARHREQYAQDSDKSLLSVWNAERRGSRMHVFPSDQVSDDPSFSSRHASFQTDDSDPTLTLPLEYPNPAFKSSLGGRDSSPLGSNYTSDEFSSPPPTPPSAASTHSLPHSQSVPSDMGAATGRPIGTRPARPSSRTRSSYASYSSTSANSRNTIRGSPHGPHSSIQIVLPSPLSPQLHPYSNSTSRAESREDFSSHNSVVDRWVSPSKAGSMYGDDDEPTNSTLSCFSYLVSLRSQLHKTRWSYLPRKAPHIYDHLLKLETHIAALVRHPYIPNHSLLLHHSFHPHQGPALKTHYQRHHTQTHHHLHHRSPRNFPRSGHDPSLFQ